MALSREQLVGLLVDEGVTGDLLWQFVAIAGRESAYQPTAHRSDRPKSQLSGDRGLFQINSVWDTQLKAAGIIRDKADLFDPRINIRAAKYVMEKQGLAAWGMGSGGWQSGGDPFRGTNVQAAKQAVQSYMAGRPDADSGVDGVMASSSRIPADAHVVQNQNGKFIMFRLQPGLWIYYGAGGVDTGGRHVTKLSNAEFNRAFKNVVNGGNARELDAIVTSYGTYANFFKSITTQVLGEGNPALNDIGVLKTIAEFAGRPDMSEQELQNKLKATDYWKARTQAEIEWNDISPAEQNARKDDARARMINTWFQTVGQTKGQEGRINDYVQQVASGQMSFSQWVEEVAKPFALRQPESPWARTVRQEQESQRQRGVDIENTVGKLEEQLHQWGLKFSEKQLNDWATALMEKRRSDEDFMNVLKAQASRKYRFKEGDLNDVDTLTAAAPWIETYNRVMERQGTLFTPEVQRALVKGTDVWDFEQELKKSAAWRGTKNADKELTSIATQVGQLAGFA